MDIKYKRLNEEAREPLHGSPDAAGWDLYAAIDEPIEIMPHETVKIGTGLAFELPQGTFGMIVPRSGIATKKYLRPANTPGICDSDYRGEYIVALHNDADVSVYVEPHERIAQLIVMPFCQINLIDSEELTNTLRGEGGFGSTGNL